MDYSIPLVEFFWRVLAWIWKDSGLSDQCDMSRAAGRLVDILKVYIPEHELSKKINESDMLATVEDWIPYNASSAPKSSFHDWASPDEDWAGITDLAERRRIQNRIAQRNYRQYDCIPPADLKLILM